MKLTIASVSGRRSRGKSGPADVLFREYLQRAGHYAPTESMTFEEESRLLEAVESRTGQTRAHLILCDSTGEDLTSARFAEYLRKLRDHSVQRVMLAIGPADGWSGTALARADRTVAFGRMTLPHELARVVLAEQTYRALTILAGHPYHCGH